MGQITWKKSTRTSLALKKTLAVTQRCEESDDGNEIKIKVVNKVVRS